jgi:hypothetical protein
VVSHPIPVQFGARHSGDPAVLVAASDKIRRFELPLPLGSAVGAAFDVVSIERFPVRKTFGMWSSASSDCESEKHCKYCN